MNLESITNSGCNVTLEDCFAILKDEEKNMLYANSSLLNYRKGEMIIRQNFSASHLYLLETGIVTINVFDDHRVSTVKILTEMNFIGIMCSFAGRQLDFSATALQDSEVRLIDMDAFQSILKRNGNFAFQFIRHISTLTNDMVHWIMRIKGRNVDGALAMLLMEFASIYKSNQFELPLTRKEFAAIIGYSKESVINTLSSFNKDRIIEVKDKSVTILDIDRLNLIIQAG